MRWLRDFNTRVLSLAILAILAVLAAPAYAAEAHDVAPTGSLRVAVGVGPAPSPFWATRDPASGKLRGVTVELGKAAAEKLGVPLQLVEYPNSGEIAAAADKNAWDISFMPATRQGARRRQRCEAGGARQLSARRHSRGRDRQGRARCAGHGHGSGKRPVAEIARHQSTRRGDPFDRRRRRGAEGSRRGRRLGGAL